MRILDGNLYLEYREMLDCGFPDNTLKKWDEPVKITDPLDARCRLISYEHLKPKYQLIIRAKYNGDPYEFFSKQPILNHLRTDAKAEQFFEKYKLPNGFPLPRHPKNYVQAYTTAASWLNLIIALLDNKKQIKKQLNLTIDQFWKTCCDLIKANKIDLPTSDRNLRQKIKEYKREGYEALISGHFCNSNSLKIGKTAEGEIDADVAAKQIALIRKAASLHQNFTPEEIAINVNPVFQKNGWTMLSRSTIANIVSENKHIVTPGKRGSRTYNSTIARQVLRKRPDHPLQFFTLDGWTVELLYQNQHGYDNRLVMVVVLDTMNNYPAGYAIGERENIDLIRAACRNAMIHIHDLFGKDYRPWHVQSDHYGIKQQTPFYQAMGHLFIPAAVGNAKSKVIEPYFKDINKKYCKYFPNWSGFNINARRENQPNAEYLDKIKKNFPDKKGVIAQIEYIIQQERQRKIEEYRRQWQAMPSDLMPPIMDQKQYITVFGKQTGYLNSITGRGLCPTIEGHHLVYDTFDPVFRSLAHLKWRVTYDETNLDHIVATSEDGKHSFLLERTRAVESGVVHASPEDHEYRSRISQFNKERRNEIIQTYTKDAELVEQVINNTPLSLDDHREAMIKLMFTNHGQQKERLQDAKKLGKKKQLPPSEPPTDYSQKQRYLDSKMDFNQYLD